MVLGHRHVHRRDWALDGNTWVEIVHEGDREGANAVNQIANNYQDSNDVDGPAMTEQQPELRDVKTVYRTLSQDFEGPIGSLQTMTTAENTLVAHAQEAKATDKAENEEREAEATTLVVAKSAPTTTHATTTTKADKQAALQTDTSAAIPSAIDNPNETSVADDELAKATGDATVTAPLHTINEAELTSAIAEQTASASSTSASSADEVDAGASAGAKAGIAFGVLGGLLIMGLLIFFIISRRRKQAERQRIEDDHEKLRAEAAAAGVGAGLSYSKSNPKAPRLSLRPVTQFFPAFNSVDNKRNSKGAAMTLGPASAAGARGGPYDRPSTSQSTHSANPFGNHAERSHSPILEEHDMQNRSGQQGYNSSPSDPFTANGPLVGGAVGGLARKTSRREGPNKLDLTLALPHGPPSPSGTEFSDRPDTPGSAVVPSAGAAAIAAAGGPANTSVHRVQLDFKSTLEDELDLKAGQLVRLLHEYDDGWALCIRLDRSQQGVAPRTCLSTRPVKPRPPPGAARSGPPIQPQGGGPNGAPRTGHAGHRGPPVSMNQNRPAQQQGGQMGYGDAQHQRIPSGPTKPVPGQAY